MYVFIGMYDLYVSMDIQIHVYVCMYRPFCSKCACLERFSCAGNGEVPVIPERGFLSVRQSAHSHAAHTHVMRQSAHSHAARTHVRRQAAHSHAAHTHVMRQSAHSHAMYGLWFISDVYHLCVSFDMCVYAVPFKHTTRVLQLYADGCGQTVRASHTIATQGVIGYVPA
jgi:hypothetical protein